MAKQHPAVSAADREYRFDPAPKVQTTAIVHSFAEEVILRVAAQARRDRMEASASKIAQLTAALMSDDDQAAATFVRDARLGGMTADTLYYGLIAGSVQQVGEAWAREAISMPLMLRTSHRVWRIMNDLRDIFVRLADRKPGQYAVFAPCPEESHMIGLRMTADDLRRRGWEIDVLASPDAEDLIRQIEQRAPITVALGATSPEMILPLARLIVALRAHVPGVWVIIGGAITTAEPDLLALTGADAIANTAEVAEQLMLGHIADLRQNRSNRM
ncbi:MAG: cobalamin-dependent protein [Cypionkella sp.]|nr:cobalamin-dependent protein [Cypionkella sp.]